MVRYLSNLRKEVFLYRFIKSKNLIALIFILLDAQVALSENITHTPIIIRNGCARIFKPPPPPIYVDLENDMAFSYDLNAREIKEKSYKRDGDISYVDFIRIDAEDDILLLPLYTRKYIYFYRSQAGNNFAYPFWIRAKNFDVHPPIYSAVGMSGYFYPMLIFPKKDCEAFCVGFAVTTINSLPSLKQFRYKKYFYQINWETNKNYPDRPYLNTMPVAVFQDMKSDAYIGFYNKILYRNRIKKEFILESTYMEFNSLDDYVIKSLNYPKKSKIIYSVHNDVKRRVEGCFLNDRL